MTGRAKALTIGLGLVVLLAAGVGVLAGQAEPAGAVPVPRLDLRTERYRLANGLEVILRKETRLPVVAVNIWYHVGPANEVAGRTGFAHLFEHMMFEGSGHVPEGEADRLLEGVGSSENASTNFDYTDYIVPDVPANQLELALWLQSDRMGFLLDRLDQANLSNQQAVVRNERRERYDDAPYGLADEELYHRLFPPGHPYHADIIGSHADIQAARLGDVRDFFRHYYVPNNASLAIVGDIDVARTKALIEKYFGTIPRGPDVRRGVATPPAITAEQRVQMTDAVELPRVRMAWLTAPIFSSADYDANVTSRILGGTRASRLTRRLVHDLQIAQSVDTDVDSMADASVFTITATPKPGHTLAELEREIDAELADLAHHGPTAAEVRAADTAIIARTVDSLDDLGGFGGLADQLNFYNHYLGSPDKIADDLRRTAAVTPDRVRGFAATQLDPAERVVVEVTQGPKPKVDDPPAPEEPAGNGATGNGYGQAAAAPPSAEPWRNTVPTPGPAPGTALPAVQRFTLRNGLPVWLVESHRLPMVSASLVSRLGSAADPPDRPGLTDLATATLDAGTTHRDAMGLTRELEAAGATLANDTGKDGTGLTATALTGRAGATLSLLADVARNPTFPSDEVDRVRDADIVALRQARDNADTIAGTVAVREIYGGTHPYGHRPTGTEDGLRAATVDDLRRAHARGFTPATTALVLAGDVTPSQARSLTEDAFGSWPGPPPAAAPTTDPGPPAGSPDRVLVVDRPGASQTALVLAAPGVAASDPDYEPLLVTNQVLGGGFSSRLNQDLREDKGYTYGVYSSIDNLRGPGLITISLDVQTESTADAVGETRADLDRLITGGVTDDELTRARQSIAGSIPSLFATRSDIVGTLRSLYLDGRPAYYYNGRPARLARITATDVAAMARSHLPPGNFKVVAVGDRAAIEAPLRALNLGPVTPRSP